MPAGSSRGRKLARVSGGYSAFPTHFRAARKAAAERMAPGCGSVADGLAAAPVTAQQAIPAPASVAGTAPVRPRAPAFAGRARLPIFAPP